jgi:putative CocE/NonD family hydrolase
VVRAGLEGFSYAEWLRRWPLRRGRTPLALAPLYERHHFDIVEHETLDEFWRRPGLSPAEYVERWPDIPTLWICGWFDWYAYAHPDTLVWDRLRRLGHRGQVVVFGPWEHGDTGPGGELGHVTFGPAASVAAALPDHLVRWFDRCLKGAEDELYSAPARYFLMGGGSGEVTGAGLVEHGGSWRTAAAWPPEEAQPRRLHLHRDGRLGEEAPSDVEASTSYRSDPAAPVPASTGICYTVSIDGRVVKPGAWDQTEGPHLHDVRPPYFPLAARSDVLVFQTEPLPAAVTVAGQPWADVWLSSDAVDADVVVKLVDVYPPSAAHPHGFALAVSEGVLRAKFRGGFESMELMEPGEVYRLNVDLRAVANVFAAGHRIRLDVAGSSWPHADTNTHTGRNPATDDETRVARHTVHHDAARPSVLVLPVL